MIREGQIVLFPFPQTNLAVGSLRPALILRKVPGPYDDWLICMISSQLRHELPEIDDRIDTDDADFGQSGLRTASLIRATRLAVVGSEIFEGRIGSLPDARVARIRERIAAWING